MRNDRLRSGSLSRTKNGGPWSHSTNIQIGRCQSFARPSMESPLGHTTSQGTSIEVARVRVSPVPHHTISTLTRTPSTSLAAAAPRPEAGQSRGRSDRDRRPRAAKWRGRAPLWREPDRKQRGTDPFRPLERGATLAALLGLANGENSRILRATRGTQRPRSTTSPRSPAARGSRLGNCRNRS